jgi:hypothetical protein
MNPTSDTLSKNKKTIHPPGFCVTKRDGTIQPVAFDKISKRLKLLCEMEPKLSEIVGIKGCLFVADLIRSNSCCPSRNSRVYSRY